MRKKLMAMLLSVTMLFSLVAPSALAAEGGIVIENGRFTAEKISNPTAGEGEVDGLEEGGDRLNSYAWSMAELKDESGDYIYIGSNCDMLYAAVDMGLVGDLDKDLAAKIVKTISNDEIFTDCSTPDFAKALILRYNVKTEKIEPWFDPQDYPLLDAEGEMIPKNQDFAYVSAFRVAQNFKGQLYINATVLYPQLDGSTVEHTEIYRIGSNNAIEPEVVWSDDGGTLLRAMAVSADGQTMYFGGIITVSGVPQIKIYETKTGNLDSFEPIADGTESVFQRYETDEIPEEIDINKYYNTYWTYGGNVWDLIEYQNELYMTLMTNYGGMIFKAHKDIGNESANNYGWVWTEFVGDATEVVGYGAGFDNRANYSFSPFIYKGNLYFLGFTSAFDPVTVSTMSLLSYLYPAEGETGSINDFLDSLYPMERSLDNECSIFRMTPDGKMQMVMGDEDKCPEGFDYVATVGAGFNDADYSTTLYNWRAAEYNGKLYVGTFDSYTLFKMFTKLTNGDLLNMSGDEFRQQLEYVKAFIELIMTPAEEKPEEVEEPEANGEPLMMNLMSAPLTAQPEEEMDSTMEAVKSVADFYNNPTLGESTALTAGTSSESTVAEKLTDAAVDALFDVLVALQQNADKEAVTNFLSDMLMSIPDAAEDLNNLYGYLTFLQKYCPDNMRRAIVEVKRLVGALRDTFESIDEDGIACYVRISDTIAANDNPGFELYCTEDGIHYETVTLDGFHDEYNYGCRTLVATDGGLMLGTANPYYGAQLWRITDTNEPAPAPVYYGSSVTTYKITCGEGVTANKKTAASGATVTLTVEDGYADPVATDKNGNVIEVKADGENYTFKMPRSNVTVSVTSTVCLRDDTCLLAKFPDLRTTSWYHDSIHYCLENELMNGLPDGTFQPSGSTTRSQIVMMLWRLAGNPVVNYELPFTDVKADGWYTEAVRWATAEGIANGISDTEFAPSARVTREQLATMLYNFAVKVVNVDTAKLTADTNTLSYEDVFTVRSWANEGVHFCLATGVMGGYKDGTIKPRSEATRAEVAKMFMGFCENVLAK